MSEVIPVEAVEAALAALLPDSDLESLKGGFWWGNVETILEAAAPHMLAAAWEEGREYGIDEVAGDVTGGINPYRKGRQVGC